MLDLMTPLGRPPLDTYSPTQVVRTAEPLPAGIWEIELGSATLGFIPAALFQVGIRYGLLPGLQIDATLPANYSLTGRRNFGIQYAPIPALWGLSLSYDVPVTLNTIKTQAVEAGTTFEIALPWLTPRIAPRVSYNWKSARIFGYSEYWETRVDVGFETPRLFRALSIGADFDYGTTYSTANLGIRTRIAGNLGAAVHGGLLLDPTIPSPAPKAGLVVSLRF